MNSKHFMLTRTLQGVSSWGFHPCLEVWEDQDNPHQGGPWLLLPRASAEQVRILLAMDTKSMFFHTLQLLCVCVTGWDKLWGMKCSMCCVRKPAKDPCDKTFPQPTNALEVYRQIQDCGKQANAFEIGSKSSSVCVGQIQPGQVIRVWWKPGGQRVRVTITMVQCN